MIAAAAVVGSNNVVAWRLVGRVFASVRFKFASTIDRLGVNLEWIQDER